MRYQKLGNTGLFVSELCLGTMTFGGEEGMWGKIGQLRQAEANSWSAARWTPGSTLSIPPTSTRKGALKRLPVRR
ncbi:oxidoreductase, aldo/keto reductase family [Klebsiella variicola]|nr:oxidoreductase, aldo/keto reductase family [Klebsiella variicola]